MTNCEKCTLSGDRISGSGSSTPKIIFVGEAPGFEEHAQGVPFVGRAGKVLRSVINYIGLIEDEYYLTNVCMCRPPENRTPSSEEITCCHDRLIEEIRVRNPEIVVALGSTPMSVLFSNNLKISKDRGKLMDLAELDIKGIATYHPAATLYAKGDTLFPFILGDIQKAVGVARGAISVDEKALDTKVVIIDTQELADSLIDRLLTLPRGTTVAFDWETTGLSPLWDTGYCLGLSWEEGTAVTIPIRFVRKMGSYLAACLDDKFLVGFNAIGFDAGWNKKYGLPHKVGFDPMLWHYLIDERPQQRSLENLSSFYLNAPCYESEMMAEYGAKKSNMIETIPAEVVYEYCGKDVDWTLRLTNYFMNTMTEDERSNLLPLYNGLLAPAVETFNQLKRNGFWVDQENLALLEQQMTTDLASQLEVLKQLSDKEDFNPNSHKQVQEVLWDDLNLIQPEMYGRKDRSADKVTLEQLAIKYPDIPFIHTLMEYRKMFTLYSRYVRDLPDYIESDGRVRADYHFDRTETGRLSTTNPAIHQIPRDGRIRSILSAPPGHVLVQADYAQIEIRVAAAIAQDEKLIDLLKSGADFHTMMASQAFKIPMDKVTEEQRQAAKTVSFGLLYLMSEKGLIVKTGLPKQDAVDFIRNYKSLMPQVQEWIERTKEEIKNNLYISSPFGRRRRFPFVTFGNIEGLYREGVNFPIQSGASDVTLTSVIKLNEVFNSYYPEAKIVAMVHDSIVVECPVVVAEEVSGVMKRVMENTPFKDVPFPVEIKVGQRWGEGSKI
jgi:DNA polymerase I